MSVVLSSSRECLLHTPAGSQLRCATSGAGAAAAEEQAAVSQAVMAVSIFLSKQVASEAHQATPLPDREVPAALSTASTRTGSPSCDVSTDESHNSVDESTADSETAQRPASLPSTRDRTTATRHPPVGRSTDSSRLQQHPQSPLGRSSPTTTTAACMRAQILSGVRSTYKSRTSPPPASNSSPRANSRTTGTMGTTLGVPQSPTSTSLRPSSPSSGSPSMTSSALPLSPSASSAFPPIGRSGSPSSPSLTGPSSASSSTSCSPHASPNQEDRHSYRQLPPRAPMSGGRRASLPLPEIGATLSPMLPAAALLQPACQQRTPSPPQATRVVGSHVTLFAITPRKLDALWLGHALTTPPTTEGSIVTVPVGESSAPSLAVQVAASPMSPTTQMTFSAPLPMNQAAKLQLLGRSVFGSLSLPPGAVEALAACSTVVRFHRGEALFRCGEAADSLFVIAGPDTVSLHLDAPVLSPMASPSNASRRAGRGLASPPIASSGFYAAKWQLRTGASSPINGAGLPLTPGVLGRRSSEPTLVVASTPQPLTSIREIPVAAEIAAKSNGGQASLGEANPTSPLGEVEVEVVEKEKPSSLVLSPPRADSPRDLGIFSYSASSSPSSSPCTLPASDKPLFSRSRGDVLGCDGLSLAHHAALAASPTSLDQAKTLTVAESLLQSPPKRSYTARCASPCMDVLRVSYLGFLTLVWPALSRTTRGASMVGEALLKCLASKEFEAIPQRATPVPTLQSITALEEELTREREEEELEQMNQTNSKLGSKLGGGSKDDLSPSSSSAGKTIAAGAGSSSYSSVSTSDSSSRSDSPPSPVSVRHVRSLTTACKYDDLSLLQHPLFQKVFYVYCQSEQTHELLEFWRDCANFRSGANKAALSLEEEAKILHRAYLVQQAKKFQRHLPQAILDAIGKQVKEAAAGGGAAAPAPAPAPTSTPSPISAASVSASSSSTPSSSSSGLNRFLFLDAERCTEHLLTSGSLRSFKMTTAFAKIMPFTTPGLPKERRSKKQTIEDLIHSWPRRRSLSGAAATQVQATSPEAIQMAEINSSTGAASTTSAAGSSSPAALGSSLAVDVAAHPPAQMPMYRARSLPETIDDEAQNSKAQGFSSPPAVSTGGATPVISSRSTPLVLDTPYGNSTAAIGRYPSPEQLARDIALSSPPPLEERGDSSKMKSTSRSHHVAASRSPPLSDRIHAQNSGI